MNRNSKRTPNQNGVEKGEERDREETLQVENGDPLESRVDGARVVGSD